MKTGTKLLLGCLALPALVMLALGVIAVLLVVAPTSESQVRTEQLRQELGGDQIEPDSEERKGSAESPASGTRPNGSEDVARSTHSTPAVLTIDLEEGEFEIVPGVAPSSLTVDARYNGRAYALEQRETRNESGSVERLIRFRRKALGWIHVIRGASMGAEQNRVRIELPVDTPLELVLRVEKGQARIDLSGVPLSSLRVEVGKGQADVSFSKPNPHPMSVVVVQASMGEFRVHGLGHTGAQEFDLSGSMGEFLFDLDGQWRRGATGSVKVSMGEATIDVPDTLDVRCASRSVFMGEIKERSLICSGDDVELDAGGPRLDLDLAVWMGDLVLK